MMRSVVHCGAKVLLGLCVYIMLFLAGILSMLDTVCKMISRILEQLPAVLIVFVLCIAVVLSVGFLSDAGGLQEEWRTYTTVVMWVVMGAFCWLIGFLGPVAAGLIQGIFVIMNPGVPSAWLASMAKLLAEKYMKLEKGEAEPWMSIIMFPYMVTEYAGMLLGFTAKAAACIGTPLILARLGYLAMIEAAGVVEKGSADWWLCVVFTALCGLFGLYLGIAASQAVQLGEEE